MGKHDDCEEMMDCVERFGKTYLMPRSVSVLISKCSFHVILKQPAKT